MLSLLFIQIVRYRYGWIHCRSIRECTLGRAQIRAQIPFPLPRPRGRKTDEGVMLPMQPLSFVTPGVPPHDIPREPGSRHLSRFLSIFLPLFLHAGVSFLFDRSYLLCAATGPHSWRRGGSKDCWMWSRSSYMPCGVKSQNSVARPLAQLNPAPPRVEEGPEILWGSCQGPR